MQIPNLEHPAWAELIEGKKQVTFQFLATRILVGRLVLKYKTGASAELLNECINELINFFKRNSHLPQAQADLNTIFGGGLS